MRNWPRPLGPLEIFTSPVAVLCSFTIYEFVESVLASFFICEMGTIMPTVADYDDVYKIFSTVP